MSTLFLSFTSLPTFPSKFHHSNDTVSVVARASAVSAPEKRTRRKKRQPKGDDDSPSSSLSSSSAAEKSLRFTFMEELMSRARNRDAVGVSDVIYDMVAAGLSPGPRSFHGLIDLLKSL